MVTATVIMTMSLEDSLSPKSNSDANVYLDDILKSFYKELPLASYQLQRTLFKGVNDSVSLESLQIKANAVVGFSR